MLDTEPQGYLALARLNAETGVHRQSTPRNSHRASVVTGGGLRCGAPCFARAQHAMLAIAQPLFLLPDGRLSWSTESVSVSSKARISTLPRFGIAASSLPRMPHPAVTLNLSACRPPPPTFDGTPISFHSARMLPAVTPFTGVSVSSNAALSRPSSAEASRVSREFGSQQPVAQVGDEYEFVACPVFVDLRRCCRVVNRFGGCFDFDDTA